MNKAITAKTQISAIFLVIILVAGTFSVIFPLFIIKVESQTAIPSEDAPHGIMYDPVYKSIYVTNFGN